MNAGPAPRQTLIVGITGHLLLSEGEQANARQALEHAVADSELFRYCETLHVLTGLAPGADLLATRVLRDLALRQDKLFYLEALLVADPNIIVQDWSQRSREQGGRPSAGIEADLEHEIRHWVRSADSVLRLDDDLAGRTAFQRLGARLVLQSDILVAIVRDGHDGRPGGAAEVLSWRQQPQKIPSELRLPGVSGRGGDYLIVDPSTGNSRWSAFETVSLERSVESIKQRLASGNPLSAHDLAAAAMETHPQDVRIRYLFLLSLASAGSPAMALARYAVLAPPEGDRDEDWLALRGRLHKDLALAGEDPQRNLALAAREYSTAHQRTGGTFSLVNAASMHLLAGEERLARELAQTAQRLLDTPAPSDETGRYYWLASRAEAYLVGGNIDACTSALIEADGLIRYDLRSRGRTRRQLKNIASYLGENAEEVCALTLPDAYVLDLLGADIAGVSPLPSGLGAKLKAAPCFAVLERDPNVLSVIEGLMSAGAVVHLVLPNRAQHERQIWRSTFGEQSAAALTRVISTAARTAVLTGFLDSEWSWQRREAYRLAYGLARVNAGEMDGQVRVLRLDRLRPSWEISQEVQIPAVRNHVRSSTDQGEATRCSVGLVFTDLVGFRQYGDDQILLYWQSLMPELAAILDEAGEAVRLRQTWGDAIHVVTQDARSAVAIGLQIVRLVRNHPLCQSRPGGSGGIRVGTHFAPAFEGHDPVENIRTYFGTQLSFAASVEPITPPGQVYATEPCAASLALEAPDEFRAEYAGEIDLAKGYGSYRLFAVSPRVS